MGFIRKLPHHLIEAFKSTLEEAKYSDIILHVVDCSNPQMDMQMHVVYETLRQLEVEDKVVVTVFNKIDQMTGGAIPGDLSVRLSGEDFRQNRRGIRGADKILWKISSGARKFIWNRFILTRRRERFR